MEHWEETGMLYIERCQELYNTNISLLRYVPNYLRIKSIKKLEEKQKKT